MEFNFEKDYMSKKETIESGNSVELALYIENQGEIYRRIVMPTITNLARNNGNLFRACRDKSS
jgi:hypothetical protein